MSYYKLFLVKSRGFRAYVVAENTEKAWEKFKNWLEEHSYGCYWERDFQSIELVARDGACSPKTNIGATTDDEAKDDMLFL